jgi:Type I phosphodiesterase / nucleotide pyrophosphatase
MGLLSLPMIVPPSYDSVGLVNLMAEIEFRLTGHGEAPRLAAKMAGNIPEADTVVLVLFDGLGAAQLHHEGAALLAASSVGNIEAGFPTTTSVSLATIATGVPPGEHGVVSHLMWMPEYKRIVNTLKWVDLSGERVDHDYAALFAPPNLWERLRAAGVEPITVQPGDFDGSPLTKSLYRGSRFEGIWDIQDLINATVQLAAEPNRFIFTYVPHVDYAGHVFGLDSPEFGEAMSVASRIWSEIQRQLPARTVLIGTADHGLIDYSEEDKVLIRDPRYDTIRIGGDPRGLQVWSTNETAEALAEATGGVLVDPESLLGPTIGGLALERLAPHMILAPDGKVLLPRGFDKRLRAYHGGLAPAELDLPLLVG